MNCEAKFLDALGVELQRLPSLRLVWCQSSGRVWCSAGMRQRFGLTATYFDELAGWGLIHPEDHSRALEAFEALNPSEEPALVHGLRKFLAPGLWSEFDFVYAGSAVVACSGRGRRLAGGAASSWFRCASMSPASGSRRSTFSRARRGSFRRMRRSRLLPIP